MSQVTKHSQTVLAGGFAGMFSKTCTAPLERVQMLNQTGATHTTIVGTLKRIYKSDYIIGFWKGNFANCIRIFPHKSILFSVNDLLKNNINIKSASIAFITGALAGSIATIVTYPIDLIRAHLSGTFDVRNTSIRKVLHSVYKSNGIYGFYRGLSVTLIGAFPYESVRIGTYSFCRDYIPTIKTNYGEQPHPLGKLISGAFAGGCAAITTYPSDTVRRMLQVQGSDGLPLFNGVIDCLITTYKNEGMIRFYHGISAKLVRVIPDAAILFITYEFLKDNIENIYTPKV